MLKSCHLNKRYLAHLRPITLFWLLSLTFSQFSVQAGPASEQSLATESSNRKINVSTLLDKFPLTPADTSSPRATFESFEILMREGNSLLLEAYEESIRSMELTGSAPTTDKEKLAQVLFRRAEDCFDLSSVPTASRKRVSLEIVLLMKEVLDRMSLPDSDQIPGKPAGLYLDSNQSSSFPARWTLPFSEITIARMAEGPKAGKFLFSADTVNGLRSFYQEIKHYPHKSNASQDLYQYFAYSPGHLIPPFWFTYIEQLPVVMFDKHWNQALWQWCALFVVALTLIGLVRGFLLVNRKYLVSDNRTISGLLSLFPTAVIGLAIVVFTDIADDHINMGGNVMQGMNLVSEAILWSLLAKAAYQLSNLLAYISLKKTDSGNNSLENSMLNIVSKVLGFFLALLVLGFGAARIGLPVYGIVTGLGVGGMAIAFAIRPTMENLIGGFILYMDKTLKVGDFCKFGEHSGTVEEIGIRSTRVRALDRTQITIVNGDLVKMRVINYSRRDKFHLHTTLGLRYETSTEQMDCILTEIRQLLEEHPMITEDPLRVRFVKFNDYSLDIEIYAYVVSSDRNEFLEIQEAILLSIANLVSTAKLEFAFPSSTTYLAKDVGQEINNQAKPNKAAEAVLEV